MGCTNPSQKPKPKTSNVKNEGGQKGAKDGYLPNGDSEPKNLNKAADGQKITEQPHGNRDPTNGQPGQAIQAGATDSEIKRRAERVERNDNYSLSHGLQLSIPSHTAKASGEAEISDFRDTNGQVAENGGQEDGTQLAGQCGSPTLKLFSVQKPSSIIVDEGIINDDEMDNFGQSTIERADKIEVFLNL